MNDVGESPNHGDAEEGDAEEHDVQQPDAKDVGQPDAPAVHHTRVGVHLAVRRSHVHVGSCLHPLKQNQTQVSAQVTVSIHVSQLSLLGS